MKRSVFEICSLLWCSMILFICYSLSLSIIFCHAMCRKEIRYLLWCRIRLSIGYRDQFFLAVIPTFIFPYHFLNAEYHSKNFLNDIVVKWCNNSHSNVVGFCESYLLCLHFFGTKSKDLCQRWKWLYFFIVELQLCSLYLLSSANADQNMKMICST